MAKQLLLNVLVDTLGPFVEGLSYENLKLGVWSGKIELYNLQLKPGVLDNLNLPISVKHGSLKSLRLKIPWTSLESKPVKVSIDGVYLLASPIDVNTMSTEEVKQRTAMDRKTKLNMAEETALAAGVETETDSQTAEKTTYIQQLTAKIVDNLEVTLTNVHIRYEDDVTVKGTTIAAGLTLDRITLATTDMNWKEMFVSRVEKDKTLSPSIHKVGRMENLAVYWNTRAERLDDLSEVDWEKEMKALIYRTPPADMSTEPDKVDSKVSNTGSSSVTKFFTSPVRTKSIKDPNAIASVVGEELEARTQLMYLVPPPNKLEVRIVHTDNAQQSTPKIDLSVEISSLRLDLDKLQYQQLMSTIRMFTELEKQKLMSLHRPRLRPTQSPKLWWKYAYRLVAGRPPNTTKKIETILLCCKYREKYIRLVKSLRFRIRNNIPAPKAGSPEAASIKDEEAQIAFIEELLPLQTLIVFRQVAAFELCREEKTKLAKQTTTSSATSYFSSWFSGSKSKNDAAKDSSTPVKGSKQAIQSPKPPIVDDDDELLIERIRSQLAVKTSSSSNQIMLRMNLRGDLAVALFSDGLPMCRLELALISDVEVKASAFTISFSLYDFFVEDLCTTRAAMPYIIVSQSQAKAALEATARNRSIAGVVPNESTTAQCVVVFESTAEASNLNIRTAPVEIIWNEVCIEKILSMFVSSPDASSILSNPIMLNAMSRIAADAAVPPTLDMNIEIHIEAPKILIPEDCESMNGGCMILDMGILDMKGRISPTGDIYFTFSLAAVNVGMPEIMGDRYNYSAHDNELSLAENKLYLVNPFNISFILQNEVKTEAEMTMALDVTDIYAQLDALKIVRILRIVNVISRTVNAAFEEGTSDASASAGEVVPILHNEWGEPIADNVAVMKSGSTAVGPKKSPMDVLMIISLKSPSISAELLVSDDHYVLLSVSSLNTTVIQRPHDIVIDFKLTSINLDDSLRSETQRSIIGTKLAQPAFPNSNSSVVSSLDLREHLCSLTISTLFSRQSPLFESLQVGTDISLKFSKLYANIDELTILRLCPFAKDLFSGMETIRLEAIQYSKAKDVMERARRKREVVAANLRRNRPNARIQQQTIATSSAVVLSTPEKASQSDAGLTSPPIPIQEIASPTKKTSLISAPTGIHVSCVLSSVSIALMRTHEAVLAVNVLRNMVDLQLAYSAEIAGLSADVKILEETGTRFNLNLHSFSVTDRRPSSAQFVFKKLLCRSTFASEYSSTTTEDSEFGALQSIGSGETRKQAQGFGIPASKPNIANGANMANVNDDNILTIELDEFKGQSNINIIVREITSILTIESVTDLVDVAMKNVDAIMKLSETFVVVESPETELGKNSVVTALDNNDTTTVDSGSHRVSSDQQSSKSDLQKTPQQQSTNLSLTLNVINPRLIVLENPAIEHGRAIVLRSEICVTYSCETEDIKIMDKHERLNVALQGAEAFILVEGLTKGSPQQVVEPTSVSVLFNRRMERDILLQVKAAIVAQDIIAKLSLNDLQLANKMLKSAKHSAVESPAVREANAKKKQANAKEEQSSMTSSISMFEVNIELGNINFLAINDANDLYQPVIRFAMDNCSFDARGAPKGGELQGDGAVIFGIDYFNNTNSTWEPVLEKCRPCLTMQYSFLGGLTAEINYDRTFQINVSGNMTKHVTLFLGLLKRIGIDDDSHNADQHGIVFYNELDIPLEISDHTTGNPLLYLMDRSPVPLPIKKASRYANRSCSDYSTDIPTSFNLRALGSMENERKPILGLPLNINRPQPHYLKPLSTNPAAPAGGLSPMRSPKHSAVDIGNTEPIVEEAFENQRYNALQGKWKATAAGGLLQDPHNFSDSHGQGSLDIKTFKLPGDRWEWMQSEWTVDKHAVIGKEIDAEGWEYATSFGAFFAAKQRRTQQPFDVVRRRKWVRSRILKSTIKDISSRPLVLFWDVDVDSNGFRHIHIRSAMQLTNSLPCPLEIMLYGFGTASESSGSVESRQSDAIILEPIEPGQTFSIPLSYSHASFICFRLLTEANNLRWSNEFDCRIMSGGRGRTGFSELLKEVQCTSSDSDNPAVNYFQTLFKFSDKALTMICVPFAIVYNHLPCDYLFRCNKVEGSGAKSAQQSQASSKSGEYGLVHEGGHSKLLQFDCKSSLRLQLQVGSFLWSTAVLISHTNKSSYTIDMLSPSEHTGGMSISLNADYRETEGYKILEMHVFCTYMLVDRSQLNISVRTKRGMPQPVNVGAKVNASPADSAEGIVTASKIVERRSYGINNVSDVKGSWIEGGNNVVLFQADDNMASFGINKGHSWSEQLSLQTPIAGSKTQFEVIDTERCSAYQLAFSSRSLPGAFQATQVITVIPCFTIVNTTDENIHVRQADSNPATVDILTVRPMDCRPWHRLDATAGTMLQLCADSTDWSFGAIDIFEIGSFVLILPSKDNRKMAVVHVEVKFSDPTDLSYVTMVVWKSAVNKKGFHNTAAICIQNDTDLPITLLQDGIDFDMARLNPRCFELCVNPGENLPFGWIDPSGSTKVRAVIDASLVDSIGQQVVVDLAKVGTECNLEMMHYSAELDSVQLIVKAGAGGRIVHVIRKSLWEAEEKNLQLKSPDEFPEKDNKYFKLFIQSIGISLVAERPTRRELFGIFIDGIDIQWSETAHIAPSKIESEPAPQSISTVTMPNTEDNSSNETLTVTIVSPVQSSRSLRGKKSSLSICVMDMQVDNYSETMVYPVLLHSYHSNERKEAARKKAIQSTHSRFRRKKSNSSATSTTSTTGTTTTTSEGEEADDPLNFITFGMVKFVPQGSITATFKYLALRILEIKVAVDTSTLQLYFLDLHSDIIGESVEQILATAKPTKWIHNFNSQTIVAPGTYPIVNVPRAQRHASVPRMYIEEFVLHPIKIRFSYQHTPFPRHASEDVFSNPQYRWLKLIRGIVGVDDFLFKLNSFIVSDALESTSSLLNRVQHIYENNLKKHLVQIASQFVGSLRMIGKPVGLYRNIGAGVKDFYYEPFNGLMHSPESFVAGVGKGTGSLFKHVATGVISSTAAIVESATKGVAKGATFLSGDAEFARQREEKRRQQASGGLMAGVKAGGESVMSGIASGVTGLVTKPFEEGRKTGVTGFAKGLGLGAIGVIVKPVMGVTDGMAAVAHGLSNQMAETPMVPQIRPPRAFHRSANDIDDLVLVPLNLIEAKAQAHCQKMALKDQKKDAFIGAAIISEVPHTSSTSSLASQSQHQPQQQQQHQQQGKAMAAATGQLVYLTERYMYLVRYNQQLDITSVEMKLQYGDISHCVLQLDFLAVEVIVYTSSSGGGSGGNVLNNSMNPLSAMGCSTITVNCSDQDAAMDLYTLLYRMTSKMGSPSNMIAPDVLQLASKPDTNANNNSSQNLNELVTTPQRRRSETTSSAADSIAGASQSSLEGGFTAVDGYVFGSVNILKFGTVSGTSADVMARCEERLRTIVKTSSPGDPDFDPQLYQRELDQKVWRLIYEYQSLHTKLRASRCIATLIINRSDHHVQILRTEMMEGKNVKVLGGTVEVGGYDHESRTVLAGGGSAVVFAFGFTPNLVDPGHVKVRLFTSAFSGQLSTRKAGTSCIAVGGYNVRFLEKSSTDWWAKFVILVS